MNYVKKIFFVLFYIFTITNLFSKETVNINFKNLELSKFIEVVSKTLDKNILISSQLKGKVNFVANRPITKQELFKILQYTLQSKGYTIVEDNDILVVVKQKELKQQFKDKYIQIIAVKNGEAKNIMKILKGIVSWTKYKNKHLKPFVYVDEESNSIICIGLKDDILHLVKVIKKLDIHKPQVYVKAKIIEVNEGKSHNIGVKYGLAGGELGSDGLFTFAAQTGANIVPSDLANNSFLNISNLQRGLALGATINLLKSSQAVNIVSQPSLLCINNQESSIYVGETKSFETGTTVGTTSTVNYKREDIGLTLKVKPRISSSNKVTLDINVILEDAKELQSGQVNPDTLKKNIKTTAIVKNGEAVILGGYIKNTEDIIVDKVPLLGDIPLIDKLFTNNRKVNNKINLVIIITPYIIPTSGDLTSLREQLSQLKILEDKYLHNLEIKLEQRRLQLQSKNIKKEHILTNEELHQQRLKNILGM